MNKFFKYSLLMLLTLTKAQSCNYQLLDMYADTFNERIWSRVPNNEAFIYEHLDFMSYDDDALITKYTDAGFTVLRDDSLSTVADGFFEEFTKNCEKVYNIYEDLDPLKQASINMLLGRVTEKVVQNQKLIAQVYSNKATKVCSPASTGRDSMNAKSNDLISFESSEYSN